MRYLWFFENFFTTRLIVTIVIIIVLLAARFIISRVIRESKNNWTSQQRLRWIGFARSLTFIVLLITVALIWGEAIHGFAVSVFAISFALVFSVKELFMCFNGSIIRFRGHLYDIGDRIQIQGMRGDVIDISFLSTTIVEVGTGAANHQFTGQRVTFPNALLLSEPVVNESFLGNYYMNNICIPLKLSDDWKGAKHILLQIAQEECAPYLEQARERMRHMERTRSVELPSVEPRVTVQILAVDEVQLHLRLPSPVHLKGRLEQVVVTRFLEQFVSSKPASSS